MPIYEYQCETCGYIFEEVTLNIKTVKISTSCPVCNENGKKGIAKKIMSVCSSQVKGYNTENGYSGHIKKRK